MKLGKGLAVVPIHLLDELREHWTGIADAVMKGEAVVNGWMETGKVVRL